MLDGLGRANHLHVKHTVIFDFRLLGFVENAFDALTSPTLDWLFEYLKDLFEALELASFNSSAWAFSPWLEAPLESAFQPNPCP